MLVVDRHLLTINTGSSSLKAALYRLWEGATETLELRAEASGIGDRGDGLRISDARDETLDERQDDLPDHTAALDALMSRLRDRSDTGSSTAGTATAGRKGSPPRSSPISGH
jgi:acetate kinase